MARKKANPQDTKRGSGAKGLRPLVVDLEDLLTPVIVEEIGSNSKLSNVLTGDYNLDADSSKKTTTITFFAKTKDKAPREQVVKDILEVVEDNILAISHKDFNIEVIWDTDTKFTTGFLGVKRLTKSPKPGLFCFGFKLI